jgi:hypothetical protein
MGLAHYSVATDFLGVGHKNKLYRIAGANCVRESHGIRESKSATAERD